LPHSYTAAGSFLSPGRIAMVAPITSESAKAYAIRQQKLRVWIYDKIYELMRELRESRLSESDRRFVNNIVAGQGCYLTQKQVAICQKIIARKHGGFRSQTAEGIEEWLNKEAEKAIPLDAPAT
jgi:hypothetical protein